MFKLGVSFFEVYNDKIFDLFSKQPKKKTKKKEEFVPKE
jgi:hypothetical protein